MNFISYKIINVVIIGEIHPIEIAALILRSTTYVVIRNTVKVGVPIIEINGSIISIGENIAINNTVITHITTTTTTIIPINIIVTTANIIFNDTYIT
ncbi:MAG: hypothetical protein BWY27_01285 [Bacteroidetes bacterium ADurb.Bin234]|nr:MAG: hypothetical protein BWY27_01285 [Bacteroidetes bacterium ADurb.Bin234]